MTLAMLLSAFNPMNFIRKEVKKIMEAIERLEAKIDDLNAAIAEETAQQAAIIADLKAHATNTDDARLNVIADKLQASIDRVKAIVPDEVAPEPPGSSTPGSTEPAST